jgi:uncharacterized protein (DUF433 family)
MITVPLPRPILLKTSVQGVVLIGKTRVSLDTVVLAYLEEVGAAEIQSQYPTLTLSDVYSVIGYYLDNRSAVDSYLSDRQQLAAQVRAEAERRFSPMGVRDRLLSRKQVID